MRSNNSVMNETRIVMGLRNAEVVAAHALLNLGDGIPGGQGGRNRRVLISEDRVCGVCHKRLGGSVVAVMPDNSVVHYGCWNRAQSAGSPNLLAPKWKGASSWGRSSGSSFA
jgi:Vam6/Vps39-like protein vacuolar protein sorting-associated protein 39